MHGSQIEKLNGALLGPMVGIGVNEETYAQPQDPNNYINARYMPHINLSLIHISEPTRP